MDIYLNDGTGHFALVGSGIDLPGVPTSVATADFNGDGKTDILTAGPIDRFGLVDVAESSPAAQTTLTLELGNGDGTFQAPILIDGGMTATRVAVGDFDGDGREDIVTNGGPAGTLTVLLGNGDGTFTAGPAATLPATIKPTDLVVGDINGDGIPDILATDETDGQLDLLLGNGDGTFRAAPVGAIQIGTPEYVDMSGSAPPFTPIDETDSIAVGDLNGDGIADVVTINATDRTVVVLLGQGGGTFTRAAGFTFPADMTPYGSPSNYYDTNPDQSDELAYGDSFLQSFNPATVTIADMNNDGIPDLVLGSGQYDTLVLLGKGDGSFTVGSEIRTYQNDPANAVPIATVVGDVNGDGRTDIVTSGLTADLTTNGIDVLLNEAPAVLPATSAPVTIARSALAQPALVQTAGGGTLTQSGNALTLDLGTLGQGQALQTLTFALENIGESAADAFTGIFNTPTTAGFTVSGATLPAPVEVGQRYSGLAVAIDTTTLGQHTQTITFAPRDQSDVTTAYSAIPGTDDVAATTTSVDGADVAAELAPLTLTITDDVQAGAALPAPTITGTVAGQSGSDAASVRLFARVVIVDANANQTETVTVRPSNAANGTLSDPNAAADGGAVAGGVYSVSGTAAQVSASLQALVFTPTAHQVAPGQTVTTSFTITDADTAGQTVQDPTTSFVATAATTAAVATVESPSTIAFQNVRVGTAENQAVSIANTGPVGGNSLAVKTSTSGNALATGSVVALAAGAVDTSSIRVGLDTSSVGARSGSVALQPSSGDTLSITVSGSVYRAAAAVVMPIAVVLHVGDTDSLSLAISNTDPADGFSENLRTTLTSVSGPFSAAAGATTGAIAAGATSSALTVGLSTATAAQLTGSAILGLVSDGGGVDGLGTLLLASQTAPLLVTVDNNAKASMQLLAGSGVLTASGANYTLNLGSVAQGSASVTTSLDVINAASGPADLLSGHFALSAANAVGLTDFGDFAGLAAGQTDGGLGVSLDTSGAGTFTRTVTLTAAVSNAGGYSGALAPETLTITGTVAAAATTTTGTGTTGTGTTTTGTTTTGTTTGTAETGTATQPGTSTLRRQRPAGWRSRSLSFLRHHPRHPVLNGQPERVCRPHDRGYVDLPSRPEAGRHRLLRPRGELRRIIIHADTVKLTIMVYELAT